MATVDPFGLPPDEAIRWFREKGYALTFDWRDMWEQQHARAFTVAKAGQLDVLADIREAVDRAIAEGVPLAQFRKELTPLLQAKGWWGKQQMRDPLTGEDALVQLGSPRRLRTIYQTNLRMAMAAGRWETIERTAARRPYLRYVAVLDGREREQHGGWHGTVLPYDHPWWNTHYPPNGWGCRCKVQQLSQRDLDRFGYNVSSSAPPLQMVAWTNERTGQTVQVPRGIAPGFAYNVGKAPRGFTPPDNAPVLTPVVGFRDYGRPRARDVSGRQPPPQPWPEVRSAGDAQATRERFRREVGIPAGRESAPITDPQGMQIDFTERYLEHLLEREPQRASFVPYAIDTVRNPYEIWMVPHRRRDGSVVMRRRYVSLYDGSEGGFQIVVERTDDGYAAWTSYPRRDIDSRREGYLVHP